MEIPPDLVPCTALAWRPAPDAARPCRPCPTRQAQCKLEFLELCCQTTGATARASTSALTASFEEEVPPEAITWRPP